MKRVVVLALLPLLVIGAGAGGWFFLAKPSNAVAAPEAPRPSSEPIFVEMQPIVVPLIGKDRVEQVISIVFSLEVADEAAAQRLRNARPRLTDAYMQDLYGALDRRRILRGSVVDVEQLKELLTKTSTRVLGEGVFKSLLVQRLAQRPL